jgi:hypothetical protein
MTPNSHSKQGKDMSVKQVLIAARAKIADEKNWTRNTFARDSEGEIVTPRSHFAVCWCAAGALICENPDELSGPAYTALSREMKGDISLFNDSHGHSAVLLAFDRAIESSQ